MFFKMRDTLTCVTTERLEPVYFRKGAEEGSGYTVDEARFSYKDGKCIVDQQRARRGRDTIYRKDTLDYCVFDMLSILLQARSFDPTSYKIGDKILFPMATGKAVEVAIKFVLFINFNFFQFSAHIKRIFANA